MSRVGQKIEDIRIASGISQKQLAKKLGVSESFINEIESGRKVLNQGLIERISKVLGKDLNDVSMSFEDQVFSEEPKVETKNYIPRPTAKVKEKEKEEVNDVWNDAFGSVIKNVPIFNYNLNKNLGSKMLPIVSNKIEGYAQDKVFYLEIQDEDMIGFRIGKGDLAFAHAISEIENNAFCLIEHGNTRIIRQVKRLDNTKILLISNRSSVQIDTVDHKSIKVIARIDRIEFKL